MVAAAYFYTPHIKIGGKVFSFTVQDSQCGADDISTPATNDVDFDPAPDAYSGIITATKVWWLLIPILLISTANMYAFVIGEGEGWVAAMGAGFLVFLAVVAGYGDASWGYPVARGQYIQFGIATVITAGAFALLYLSAYGAAKLRPLRREQSMEYRAHPRHRRPS